MDRSLLVLLAEDDAELRALMGEVLRQRGHRVRECHDGHALLAQLGSVLLGAAPSPDVVVTDEHMPRARGTQVLAGLHDPASPWPLVLVTAYPDEAVRQRARSLGALVLEKPFDADELIATVERAATASTRP